MRQIMQANEGATTLKQHRNKSNNIRTESQDNYRPSISIHKQS